MPHFEAGGASQDQLGLMPRPCAAVLHGRAHMKNRRLRTIGLIVSVLALAAYPVASGSAHEIWVTNMKSGDVTVIDVSSLKVKATIKTG